MPLVIPGIRYIYLYTCTVSRHSRTYASSVYGQKLHNRQHLCYVDRKHLCFVLSFSQQPHEASRRILSVLLQKIDGFEGSSKSTLICATNRMQDLDAALLSRYDLTIRYHLPSELLPVALRLK